MVVVPSSPQVFYVTKTRMVCLLTGWRELLEVEADTGDGDLEGTTLAIVQQSPFHE